RRRGACWSRPILWSPVGVLLWGNCGGGLIGCGSFGGCRGRGTARVGDCRGCLLRPGEDRSADHHTCDTAADQTCAEACGNHGLSELVHLLLPLCLPVELRRYR